MPQSGATTSSCGALCGRARRIRSATVAGDSTSGVSSASTPRMIDLPSSCSSTARSRSDWAVSIEIWSHGLAASSGRNGTRVGRPLHERG